MSSTTRFGLRAPDGPENADVPLYIRNLASDVDPWLSRAQPRTQAQITAIASPLVGQLVFNTDLGRTQEWNGTIWRTVGAGASGSMAMTIPASSSDTQYSFFVGIGFGEVEWFATLNGDPGGGYGALCTSSASQARLQSTRGIGSAYAILAVTDNTNTAASRLANPLNTSGFFYNCYYTPTTGFVYYNLTATAGSPITQRVNWRAR